MSDQMSDQVEVALDYLRAHRVLTLATHGPAGLWAAAVFYASERFTLYFLSAPDTRHVHNLIHNPRVAGTIQENYEDWREIQGVQLEGPVQLLERAARDAAVEAFQGKFPFLEYAPDPIQEALQKVNWFKIIPDRLYFVDNRRGFGHRDRIL